MEMTGPAIQNGALTTVLSISTNSSEIHVLIFLFFSARTKTFSEELSICASVWNFTFHVKLYMKVIRLTSLLSSQKKSLKLEKQQKQPKHI